MNTSKLEEDEDKNAFLTRFIWPIQQDDQKRIEKKSIEKKSIEDLTRFDIGLDNQNYVRYADDTELMEKWKDSYQLIKEREGNKWFRETQRFPTLSV